MSKNNLAKCYLARVRRRIPVGGRHKKEYLETLRGNLECYISENPNATKAQLEKEFGTPDDIVVDFFDQMSPQEINHRFHAKNRVVAVAVALALLIAVVWIATALCALHSVLLDYPGTNMVENFRTEDGGNLDETNDDFCSSSDTYIERN